MIYIYMTYAGVPAVHTKISVPEMYALHAINAEIFAQALVPLHLPSIGTNDFKRAYCD